MWHYTFYATAFLHLTSAVLEKHYNAHEEAIFADVIRNISRVNNVLQELISNYEQLQKIYKSQEDTDYSSDTEIDEVFKSMQKANKRELKKKGKFKPTDKPMERGLFPATQMIWSEDNDDNDAEDNYVFNEKDQTDTPGKLKQNKALHAKGDTQQDDTIENTASESMEISRNTSLVKSKEAEIIFIDTHKKIEAINDNKNVSPFQKKNITKKPKTRYNKVFKNNKANMKARKNKPNNTLLQKDDTKSIKKIIYSETFSPKSIWKEIIKNKPIQLEPQKVITYNAPQKRADNKPNTSLKNDAGKTALVIVTNNNPKTVKRKDKDAFESPEDETIAKDIFKTNVLRHAYGDACTKVVIKKCYKACKQAGKSYCALYKCKSTFRSKFKDLSKTGCIREFTGMHNKTAVHYRGQDDKFIDVTRGRFLDAACLPHVDSKHKPITTRNGTQLLKTKPLTKYDKSINILRDKYEKACKKISTKKCTSACNYAYTRTCDVFNCEKKKRKNFKKYCKEQCKLIYKVYSDSDSSSTDSSSSITSSDSSDASTS